MKKKALTPGQIIGMLRDAEALLAQGIKTGEVARKLGIIEQTYYRRREEDRGMRIDQAKMLEELERENIRFLSGSAPKRGRASNSGDGTMSGGKSNLGRNPGCITINLKWG